MDSLTRTPWELVGGFLGLLTLLLLAFYLFLIRKFAPPNPQATVLRQSVVESGANQKPQDRQMALFAEYHQQGLNQSRIAFVCSVGFAALGFAVIVASLVYLLTAKSPSFRLLQAELPKAQLKLEKAEENVRLAKVEDRAAEAKQMEVEATAKQQANALEFEANSVYDEWARLAAASIDNVEPLPALLGFRNSQHGYDNFLKPEEVRSSLRALVGSVRVELLRVYLAAIPIYRNHPDLLKTNIGPIVSGSLHESDFLQHVDDLILLKPSDSLESRNLQRFIELIVRYQAAEDQLNRISPTPDTQGPKQAEQGYLGGKRYDEESSLASQLRAIAEELGRLRRSFEVQYEARVDSTFEQQFRSMESTNRILRSTLQERYRLLEARLVTNGTSFYVRRDKRINAVAEAEQERAIAKTGVESIQREITELGKSSSSTEGKGAEKSLAILGVIAGTIIDAIAGLFFVQSNRARELMVQFFDRLRADRKLDEAIRLAETVPDATAKSALLRELSLLLASSEPPVPVKDGAGDKPRSTSG